MFFVISKAMAPLLSPETWVFVLALAAFGFLLTRRLRRAAFTLGTGLALYVLIAVVPVGRPLLAALENAYPANPDIRGPAGILVLGGSESGRTNVASGQLVVTSAGDRLLAAIILARAFPEASVLFTGGIASLTPRGPTGADVAAAVLTGAGLPPERLVLEKLSRNTAENAVLSVTLRGDLQGPWVLVTSAFHMPRALASFCAAGWTDLVPWPADYRGATGGIGWDFSGHARELELAVREIVGLAAYRLAGKALSPSTAGCLYTD